MKRPWGTMFAGILVLMITAAFGVIERFEGSNLGHVSIWMCTCCLRRFSVLHLTIPVKAFQEQMDLLRLFHRSSFGLSFPYL